MFNAVGGSTAQPHNHTTPYINVSCGPLEKVAQFFTLGRHFQCADGIVPVDFHVPGFPPYPLTTLEGLLRLPGNSGEQC